MPEHTHRKVTLLGPYGCTGGNVQYTVICRCGAERRYCHCIQCADQRTNEGRWEMPGCRYCERRHPIDQSCPDTIGQTHTAKLSAQSQADGR